MDPNWNRGNNTEEDDKDDPKRFYCLCGYCHVRTGLIVIGLIEFIAITQCLIYVCTNLAAGETAYREHNPVFGYVIREHYLLAFLVEQSTLLLTIIIMLLGVKAVKPLLILPHLALQVITIVFNLVFVVLFALNYSNYRHLAEAVTQSTRVDTTTLDWGIVGTLIGFIIVTLLEVYFANVSVVCYKFLKHQKMAVRAQKHLTDMFISNAKSKNANGVQNHDSDYTGSLDENGNDTSIEHTQGTPSVAKVPLQTISAYVPPEPVMAMGPEPYMGPFTDSESEMGDTLSSVQLERRRIESFSKRPRRDSTEILVDTSLPNASNNVTPVLNNSRPRTAFPPIHSKSRVVDNYMRDNDIDTVFSINGDARPRWGNNQVTVAQIERPGTASSQESTVCSTRPLVNTHRDNTRLQSMSSADVDDDNVGVNSGYCPSSDEDTQVKQYHQMNGTIIPKGPVPLAVCEMEDLESPIQSKHRGKLKTADHKVHSLPEAKNVAINVIAATPRQNSASANHV